MESSQKDKRLSERFETMGLMSTVSDGNEEVFGFIEDVSATGFCLSKVPVDFDDTVKECVTIVKGPIQDLKINMRPCWARKTHGGMYKVVGFQVEKPTKLWESFVEHITQQKNIDDLLSARENLEM